MHKKSNNQFTAGDYVVLSIFILASLAVGIIASFFGPRGKNGKKKVGMNNAEEFVMGSRQLHMVPVAMSLVVSNISAILIIGVPTEIYSNGTMYLMNLLGFSVSLFLGVTIYVPVFYKLRLSSTFEYLELRYNSRAVRLIGNLLTLISSVVYMGMALYTPATTMQYVSRGAIPLMLSISVCGIICTFYTAWGGIKAVVWTDVFQSIVMLAGLLAIIVKGLIDLGGIEVVWKISEKYGRIEFDNFSLDPRVRHTFWGLAIGSGIASSGNYGSSQTTMQRYCAMKTLRQAKLSVILALFFSSFFDIFACLAGLVIFAYYANVGCDPNAANWIVNSNQIVPFYVLENLRMPIIPGLFVASLFAGALSSVSSSLSALAATTWEDLVKPFCCINASQTKATWINRLFIVVYGVAAVLMGLMATQFGGTVLQATQTFTGISTAPLLGLFSMGVLFPFANKYGAIAGSVVGLTISGWLSIGSYVNGKQIVGLPTDTSNCDFGTSNSTASTLMMSSSTPATTPPVSPLDDWYSISYVLFSAIGLSATTATGLIVSLLTCGHKEEVDESLINPHVARFCKFLSSKYGIRVGLRQQRNRNTIHPLDTDEGEEAMEIREISKQQSMDIQSGASEETNYQPVDQSEESVEISDQPADQSGKINEISDQPADQSGKINEISDQPADQSGKIEEISNHPADQSRKIDEISDQPADESGESEETGDQPADKSGKIDEISDKPVDQSGASKETSDQPADHSGESDETSDQPADQSEESVETSDQPADQLEESVKTNDKATDQSGATEETKHKAADQSVACEEMSDQPDDQSGKINEISDEPADQTGESEETSDQPADQPGACEETSDQPADQSEKID